MVGELATRARVLMGAETSIEAGQNALLSFVGGKFLAFGGKFVAPGVGNLAAILPGLKASEGSLIT